MSKILMLKICLILLTISSGASAQEKIQKKPVPVTNHPRILLLEGEEAAIKMNITSDMTWKTINQLILDESDKIITREPVERVLIGRRLLDKSREALRRIFFLSYSYRMTSDSKYLNRAEKELLAVSSFSDWNPSHFLDVAEMTMAAAIGYDWLYKGLSAESKTIIRDAIITKGLNPSLETANNSWVKASHNWNQVCNAGMTFGALAVYEDKSDLAQKIIDRAVSSIILPMEDYMPDGAYPEGYGYWGYGTTFNILFLSAMEKAFGNEYGLAINKGFLKTAQYLEHMTGPTGASFNYSDAGSGGGTQPAMFWFANKLSDPTLLWSEKYFLQNKKPSNDRTLPAIMIWSAGLDINDITPPTETIWVGQGKNPVALMRSSWSDPNAVFVGIKAGSPSVNHGHMDVGSFVMEANGERWAMDFGMQDYNSLESAGVNLWSMVQNSQRWDIFRYNNMAHNTLTVNNQLQTVTGKAIINSWSGAPELMNAVTDITEVYKGNLKKAVRGIAIVDKKYVAVRDEIETNESETVVRWTMVTSANVSLTDGQNALLTKNGKKLNLKVAAPQGVTVKTWTTVPTNKFDAPNPGTTLLGFEATIPANSKVALMVLLLPEGSTENNSLYRKNLENWPKSSGK